MPVVGFGVRSELKLPDQLPLAECGQPVGRRLRDPVEAMRAALAQPLGFPALRDSVVPGDRVVIALGEGLTRPGALVAGAVLELLDAGIDAEAITVLRPATDARLSRRLPTHQLAEELQPRIAVVVHDAGHREQLCMLNISRHDTPIYLNRALVEADVVVPIGVTRPTESLGDFGYQGVLFPTFADTETQQRFLTPKAALSDAQRRRRRQEAAEANWFLGSRLIVQVIPGPGESLLHILAGEAAAVAQRSRELFDAVWRCDVPRRAKLVVATVPGGRPQQSWANLARALDSALRVVEDQGTIAICCDLKSKLGPSLKRLARANSLDEANRAIENDPTADALPAAQLIRALQRARVFLLSRLDEESVQSLGLAYVAGPEEVARLATRAPSCILLENAHRVIPHVVDEVLP